MSNRKYPRGKKLKARAVAARERRMAIARLKAINARRRPCSAPLWAFYRGEALEVVEHR
jgi:hypothetical protein